MLAVVVSKQKPHYRSSEALVFALPIFPGSRPKVCRGAIRALPVADEARRASGSGRRGTTVRRHRGPRRAPQQGQMCLTSVFGMVTSPNAAGGGYSEGAVRAGVGGQRRRSRQGGRRGTPTGNRWTGPPVYSPERKRNLTTKVVRLLCSRYLFSPAVARQVSSAQMCLTSVFGMGTGGPTSQSIPTHMDGCYTIFYSQKPQWLLTARKL